MTSNHDRDKTPEKTILNNCRNTLTMPVSPHNETLNKYRSMRNSIDYGMNSHDQSFDSQMRKKTVSMGCEELILEDKDEEDHTPEIMSPK